MYNSCRLHLIHQNHSDILKLDLGIVILLLLDIGKGIRLFRHIIFIGIRQIYVCFCLIYIYLYFFYFWFVWRFMITVSIFYCLFQPFFLANKLHFSFCWIVSWMSRFLRKLYLTEKILSYNEYCMMWLMVQFYFQYQKKEKAVAFKNEKESSNKRILLEITCLT